MQPSRKFASTCFSSTLSEQLATVFFWSSLRRGSSSPISAVRSAPLNTTANCSNAHSQYCCARAFFRQVCTNGSRRDSIVGFSPDADSAGAAESLELDSGDWAAPCAPPPHAATANDPNTQLENFHILSDAS